MAAADSARPITPRSPCQAWDDVEEQVQKLTTLSGRSRDTGPLPRGEHEAIVTNIRKMLAHLRKRQENLVTILSSKTPSAEAAFSKHFEGDTDSQNLHKIMQENIIINTQILQNKRLVAETEREAVRLKNQVEEAKKRADDCSQRRPPMDPVALSLTRAEGARYSDRLQEIQRSVLLKESLLRRVQQQAGQEMTRQDALRSKTVLRARCEELRRELDGVEEQKVEILREVSDCHARLGAAGAERAELEPRLQFLRQTTRQMEKASAENAAEAAALRQQLQRTRAQCQRHEEQARADAEKQAQLDTDCALAALRTPPEVSRRPTPPPSLQPPPSSAADRLQAASAHNEWLRERLQSLQASSTQVVAELTAPPETTPEVAAPVQLKLASKLDSSILAGTELDSTMEAVPELDSTILALEAQMKAVSVQSEAIERTFDRRADSTRP